MSFECSSLAHYKICEWLAEAYEKEQYIKPAAIEAVSLDTLKITGSLGQTMTVKWNVETGVPEIQ